MSDRTKFFADQEAQHQAECGRLQQEADATKQKEQEQDRAFANAASLYRAEFEKFADELRAKNVTSTITMDDAVITALDAHTREKYTGNALLALKFRAGGIPYELVYLAVAQPSVLGMLAWSRGNVKTYYVGASSKAAPSDVPNITHALRHHVDVAVSAIQTG